MQRTYFFHPFRNPWVTSTHLYQSHWKAVRFVVWLVVYFFCRLPSTKISFCRRNAWLVSWFSPCNVSYICSIFIYVCVCINICVCLCDAYMCIYILCMYLCVYILCMRVFIYMYMVYVYMCVYMHNVFYICIYVLYVWSNMRYCVGNWKAFSYLSYPSVTSPEQE